MNASEKVIEIAFGGTGSGSGSASHADNIQSRISRSVKRMEKRVKSTGGWGHLLAFCVTFGTMLELTSIIAG